jgi:hypothetical protein
MEHIQKEYKKFLEWGYNRLESIEKALDETIKGHKPYIYKDNYEDFSHVFHEDKVMFVDGEIYVRFKKSAKEIKNRKK